MQENLASLPVADGLYLPSAGALAAYTDDRFRRDHPVVTGAYGMLPASPMVDTAVMERTFRNIVSRWNWETTWGWDYPVMAMTAARVGRSRFGHRKFAVVGRAQKRLFDQRPQLSGRPRLPLLFARQRRVVVWRWP